MKIKRKKGLKGIKFQHNKTLFWVIVALFVLLIGLLIVINILQ